MKMPKYQFELKLGKLIFHATVEHAWTNAFTMMLVTIEHGGEVMYRIHIPSQLPYSEREARGVVAFLLERTIAMADMKEVTQ